MRPPSQAELGTPQWTMLGCEAPDGTFVIYASIELTGAQMRANLVAGMPSPASYDVMARMSHVVVARGRSYAEALADLMSRWSPDRPEPLPPGEQRALDA